MVPVQWSPTDDLECDWEVFSLCGGADTHSLASAPASPMKPPDAAEWSEALAMMVCTHDSDPIDICAQCLELAPLFCTETLD